MTSKISEEELTEIKALPIPDGDAPMAIPFPDRDAPNDGLMIAPAFPTTGALEDIDDYTSKTRIEGWWRYWHHCHHNRPLLSVLAYGSDDPLEEPMFPLNQAEYPAHRRLCSRLQWERYLRHEAAMMVVARELYSDSKAKAKAPAPEPVKGELADDPIEKVSSPCVNWCCNDPIASAPPPVPFTPPPPPLEKSPHVARDRQAASPSQGCRRRLRFTSPATPAAAAAAAAASNVIDLDAEDDTAAAAASSTSSSSSSLPVSPFVSQQQPLKSAELVCSPESYRKVNAIERSILAKAYALEAARKNEGVEPPTGEKEYSVQADELIDGICKDVRKRKSILRADARKRRRMAETVAAAAASAASTAVSDSADASSSSSDYSAIVRLTANNSH